MKLLKSIKCWLYIVYLSFKWMFVINLGDLVRYNGRQYRVINGVRPEMWRLDDLKNDDDGWVHEYDCKKVLTLKNMVGSFKFRYWFYMGYWFDICVRYGFRPKPTTKGDLK